MNEQGCLGHAHLELLISPTRQPGKHLPAWICLINPGAGKVIKLGRERKSADMYVLGYLNEHIGCAVDQRPAVAIRVLDSSDGQHWISRTHAIFAYDTGAKQWTMADNSSLNGTYVDGIRLAPNTPHILRYVYRMIGTSGGLPMHPTNNTGLHRDGCVVTVGGQENHKPGEQLVGEMECTYVFNDRSLADLEPLLCAACGQLPVLAHTATCSQYALSSQVQAMRDRMSICNHYRSHFCLTCGDELAAWGDPCPVCAQALALPLHPCGVIDTLIGRTQLPPAVCVARRRCCSPPSTLRRPMY